MSQLQTQHQIPSYQQQRLFYTNKKTCLTSIIYQIWINWKSVYKKGNSADKLRISDLCHTISISPSHMFRFIYLTKFMLGHCKYVNKMHFIKWRTNRMLSSYINNNRLLTLHNITEIAQCRCSCSNYCVSSIHPSALTTAAPRRLCSGHALWPAAPATVGWPTLATRRHADSSL